MTTWPSPINDFEVAAADVALVPRRAFVLGVPVVGHQVRRVLGAAEVDANVVVEGRVK